MKPLSKGGGRRKSRKVKPGKAGLAQARRRAWLASIALERSVEARGLVIGFVCAERRAVEEEATLRFQGTYCPRYPCEKDYIREVRIHEVAYRQDGGVLLVQKYKSADLLSRDVIEGLEGRGVFIVCLVFTQCGGKRLDGTCGAVACTDCEYTAREVSMSYPFAALAAIVDDLGVDPCQL